MNGQDAASATSLRWWWRMPLTITGRAAIVALRSSPRSWSSIIEPGRTAASTALVIWRAVVPGCQSRGPTEQSMIRSPSCSAARTTWEKLPPGGEEHGVGADSPEALSAEQDLVVERPGRHLVEIGR